MCLSTLLSFPQCERLGGGLQKIAEAREQIHELNQLLEVQKVAVLEKSAACEKLIQEIAQGTCLWWGRGGVTGYQKRHVSFCCVHYVLLLHGIVHFKMIYCSAPRRLHYRNGTISFA